MTSRSLYEDLALPPKSGHSLPLLHYMPLHGLFQLFSRCSRRQIKHTVQAEYPEEVSVRHAGGRAGAGISYLTEVVVTLAALEGVGKVGLFGDSGRYDVIWRYIPDDPVDECAGRSISILKDYGQGSGIAALDLYPGRQIRSLAGVLPGKLLKS